MVRELVACGLWLCGREGRRQSSAWARDAACGGARREKRWRPQIGALACGYAGAGKLAARWLEWKLSEMEGDSGVVRSSGDTEENRGKERKKKARKREKRKKEKERKKKKREKKNSLFFQIFCVFGFFIY